MRLHNPLSFSRSGLLRWPYLASLPRLRIALARIPGFVSARLVCNFSMNSLCNSSDRCDGGIDSANFPIARVAVSRSSKSSD